MKGPLACTSLSSGLDAFAGALLPEAERELDIVSPYFVPRDSGVARLTEIAARGVRVRVLTNSLAATDVAAVHAGYAPSRHPLLEAGVQLYEPRPSGDALVEQHRRGMFGSSQASLHAKKFTIDARTVFVGSLNLDPRSLGRQPRARRGVGPRFREAARPGAQLRPVARAPRRRQAHRLARRRGR